MADEHTEEEHFAPAQTLPKCAALDCENPAFCWVAGRWLCGAHVVKIHKAQEKAIEDLINA